MMRLFLTVIFLGAFLSQASAADWLTKTEEDVFSGKQTATMIGGFMATNSLFFRCDADRKLWVSSIFKFDDKMRDDLDGVLVVKVDSNDPIKIDVTSYQHNDTYGGFQSKPDDPKVKDLVKLVHGAKSKILIGIQADAISFKASNQISTSGSTTASSQFIKACEIS